MKLILEGDLCLHEIREAAEVRVGNIAINEFLLYQTECKEFSTYCGKAKNYGPVRVTIEWEDKGV